MRVNRDFIEKAINESEKGYIVCSYQKQVMLIFKDDARIATIFGTAIIDRDVAIMNVENIEWDKVNNDGRRWEMIKE